MLVVWFAAKVFKVALLMHGRPPSFGTLIKMGADGVIFSPPRVAASAAFAVTHRPAPATAEPLGEAAQLTTGADRGHRPTLRRRAERREQVLRRSRWSRSSRTAATAARAIQTTGYAPAAAGCSAAMVSRDRFTRVAAGGRLPSSLPCQSMSSRSRCADSCTSASRKSIPYFRFASREPIFACRDARRGSPSRARLARLPGAWRAGLVRRSPDPRASSGVGSGRAGPCGHRHRIPARRSPDRA